jgi:hypothetical protein
LTGGIQDVPYPEKSFKARSTILMLAAETCPLECVVVIS